MKSKMFHLALDAQNNYNEPQVDQAKQIFEAASIPGKTQTIYPRQTNHEEEES